MGFEAPGTGNKLDFTGTKYEGLEVTVDSAPLGLLTGVMEDYTVLTAEQVDLAAAMPVVTKLLDNFAAVLEDWNVEKHGKPVPPTIEGLRTLDLQFVMAVIGAWLTGTAQAPDPLPGNSGSGMTSPEELAAMAAASSSLPSSEPQNL
jgi:hypothetical protein